MPSTKPKTVRGLIRRPEYSVVLELPGGRRLYRVEAINLDHLADVIEAEVRSVYPNTHVGVRLDPSGTVLVRRGFKDSEGLGTWAAAS